MVDPTPLNIKSVVSSLRSVCSTAKDISSDTAAVTNDALSWVLAQSISQNVTSDVIRTIPTILDAIAQFIPMRDLISLIELYVKAVAADMLPGEVELI